MKTHLHSRFVSHMAEFQIDSDSNSVNSAALKVVLTTISAYNNGIFVSKGVEIKKRCC